MYLIMIMKVRQIGRHSSIVLTRIKNLNFGEIKAMIHHDLPKSLMSTTKNTAVSEFLIEQMVHEALQYSSYKVRMAQFFFPNSQAHEEKRLY